MKTLYIGLGAVGATAVLGGLTYVLIKRTAAAGKVASKLPPLGGQPRLGLPSGDQAPRSTPTRQFSQGGIPFTSDVRTKDGVPLTQQGDNLYTPDGKLYLTSKAQTVLVPMDNSTVEAYLGIDPDALMRGKTQGGLVRWRLRNGITMMTSSASPQYLNQLVYQAYAPPASQPAGQPPPSQEESLYGKGKGLYDQGKNLYDGGSALLDEGSKLLGGGGGGGGGGGTVSFDAFAKATVSSGSLQAFNLRAKARDRMVERLNGRGGGQLRN